MASEKSKKPGKSEQEVERIKLENCPFCAGRSLSTLDCVTGFRVGDVVIKTYWVYCFECGCAGPHQDSLREACERWNVRNARGLTR